VSGYVSLPVDLESMPPGPALGAVLASLDPSLYNGFQLVEILAAQNRQVSFENARLLTFTRELTYTTWGGDEAEPTRRAEPDRFGGTEIAFALACTEYSAQALILTAVTAVDELPALHQALQAGRIDVTKAKMVVNELAFATREHARLVVDKVLQHARRATTTQLKTILRRALLKLDPDAVKKRYKASVDSRRFDHDPDPCGTASLTASWLAPDKAAAAYDYVDAIARASKAAGDPRRLHQLRADVVADLLAGVDPTLAGASTPAPRKGAITLTIGLGTLAMLDELPGELPGYGPVIADVARQTAAQMATTATWRFQVLDHHATTMAEGILGPAARNAIRKAVTGYVDRTGYRPTAAQRAFINARDRTCRAPGCARPAHRCDIDHTCDWICCQDGSIWNMCLLCRRHHMAKHQAGFKVRRGPHGTDWTTPRGHRYTVTNPDAAPSTYFERRFAATITGHTTPGKLRF